MKPTLRHPGMKILLGSLLALMSLAMVGYLYWQGFDLDSHPSASPNSTVADLEFMRHRVGENRGRILAVVTSTPTLKDSPRKAGFELTELARAYYVFLANGYEVEIASPLGGMPPMRLDEDMQAADHAFLNDAAAMHKLEHSLSLPAIAATDYAAVYLVGGKGTLFDFPGNVHLQRLIAEVYQGGGVVGAVCHGPAALLNVRLADGSLLIDGRRVTGFSNAEELFLIEDAREVFPFLLQDQLIVQGAKFEEGPLYLDKTVIDGRLVSGQNPWSTWSVAEAMIRVLGHEPVPRRRSSEERSVSLLQAYYRDGADVAQQQRDQQPDIDRRLLLMHALIAGMQGRLMDTLRIQALARP